MLSREEGSSVPSYYTVGEKEEGQDSNQTCSQTYQPRSLTKSFPDSKEMMSSRGNLRGEGSDIHVFLSKIKKVDQNQRGERKEIDGK